MSAPENLTLTTADGTALAASHYAPAAGTNLGLALQINAATAVPRRFYDAFARHAAARGFAVLSYDYRGIGGSKNAPPAMMRHWRMLDWAEQDAAAASAWLRAHYPARRLCLLGHSFGGQILGLTPWAAEYAAVLLVASQSGYWRHWPAGWPRLRMFLLWTLIPLLTRLRGEMPGVLFGGEPLPRGIALQWAGWGRAPPYISDARGAPLRPYNDRLRAPLLALSFSDDAIAPRAAVAALLAQYYPAAQVEHRHLAPADWGLPKLGHFGLFHRAMPVQHWDALLDWLIAAALPAR